MTPMPFASLEEAYEILAQAIDQAGRDQEAVFLTRLALVLAHEVGDIEIFKRSVRAALGDAGGGVPHSSRPVIDTTVRSGHFRPNR